MKKENLGQKGEKLAHKFLKKNGYKIIEKNYQNKKGIRLGEIDIIALDKKRKELVFVEVKTRLEKENKNIVPEENITASKLQKLNKISQLFLMEKKWRDKDYRFDAIAVKIKKDGTPLFKHIVGL